MKRLIALVLLLGTLFTVTLASAGGPNYGNGSYFQQFLNRQGGGGGHPDWVLALLN